MKKTYKELSRVDMFLELKGRRLILNYEKGDQIGGNIDVTSLYHFLKNFFMAKKKKITEFKCGEHGKIEYTPACPKCLEETM